MAFYARHFIFDDISSEEYGVIISSSDGGEGTSNASNDVELKTQQIFRRPVPYFYGVTQNPVLEFDAEITTTENEITLADASLIQKWLFGQANYKKLRIVQYDMEDIYFNCFLKNPQIKRVGNIIRGYNFRIVCDSPFAWSNPITYTYAPGILEADVTYYKFRTNPYNLLNTSDNVFYTYPILILNTAYNSGDFSITNNSDAGRTFIIEDVDGGSVVTIDNDLQIVTSVPTQVSLLNKLVSPTKFFRLIPGVNSLTFSGNIHPTNGVSITYTPARKVG